MPSRRRFHPLLVLSSRVIVAAASIVSFSEAQTAFGTEQVVKVKGTKEQDSDEPLAGFGFGHWEGVEPLITRIEPENRRQKITKAETLAPEAVIWVGPNPVSPPTFRTAAIFPDEAFAVIFRGELSAPEKGGGKGKGGGGDGGKKDPEIPKWAVAVNDVDLDFDSDNNSTDTPRGPDSKAPEDLIEFSEESPAAGGFGMRIGKEEGWVKLVLRCHAKSDGVLSFQASNTKDFQFADEQGASLTVEGAPSSTVGGATVLFQREVTAGSPIPPVTILAKVTEQGKAGEGTSLVVGQFEPKIAAKTTSGQVKAIDKGLLRVEADVDFDFTDDMLQGGVSGNSRFIYPCVKLCKDKKFLRYKTGTLKAEDVKHIKFEIKDKANQLVWDATDTVSADWKPIFPACRANKTGSKDFDGKPYEIGGKWKFIDPGKNGEVAQGAVADHDDFAPVSSTYHATMTVEFKDARPPIVRRLNFDARSRSVLITRVTDPQYGSNGEGTAIGSWQGSNDGSQSFATEPTDPKPMLMFKYEEKDFRDAFSALTPRGRLLTINHGGRVDPDNTDNDNPKVDGATCYGAIYGEGPDGFGKSYAGFSDDGDFRKTAYTVLYPSVKLGDLLEPYGAFTDVAYCWSAHRSGDADQGPSVHETLASTVNVGACSGTIRGYVGICSTYFASVDIRPGYSPPAGLPEVTSTKVVNTAIDNLVQPRARDFGLGHFSEQAEFSYGKPWLTETGLVQYGIDPDWLADSRLAATVPMVEQILLAGKLQAEIDRLCKLDGLGTISITRVVVTLNVPKAVATAIDGDDEQKANPEDAGWGFRGANKDCDTDDAPSSSADDPTKPDDPQTLIIVDPK
jgi:hypothetical protein